MQKYLQSVIDFWFSLAVKEKWWDKDDEFDAEIKDKFLRLHQKLASEGLSEYLFSAQDALAVVIVLDQFSRNMFRDEPQAFAYDNKALNFAALAIDKGLDKDLNDEQVAFLYMPYMHSENLADHGIAVKLFSSRAGLAENLKFEFAHKEIIERFGRYPHRNKVLDRPSTAKEIEFLKEPNSSF